MMTKPLPFFNAFVFALFCVGTALAQTDDYEPDFERGRLAFRECAICHSFYDNPTRRGPTLIGVFGRQAGTLTDFGYSQAVRESGIIWTGETIAEWANAAKSQFLANVSHELRTPLNAIIGFSDMVRHQALGPISNNKYIEYNQDIHDSAVHLLGVINDILDYARVDAGKVELSEARVCVDEIVERAFKQIRMKPEANGILLEKTIQDELPDLHCDERLVTQVLINLLVNALKFTGDGGRIGLTAGLTASNEVCFKVSDTGIGIPEDDLKELGKPFVKSQFTRRTSDEGFGLGLAISKEFMNLHDGALTIASRVDYGTTVTCTFPQSRTLD